MKSLKELMDLKDRVALITGGAGHIGFSAAETLAELGAKIVLLDIDKAQCDKEAEAVANKYNVETLPLAVDLAKEDKVRLVPKAVLDKFGRLDILVNCAALVGSSELKGWAVPFENQLTDAWRVALEVNLTSIFVLVQACQKALAYSGQGSIINISSIYGLVGPDMRLYQGT
ncbi:MAG: SDR family NAD(P)-dependent oxidoreductase, partial [Candidatus Omnitrophica bacterium]|nr:SDR family NAD(P)-dependent oxidoreductase [Candidatus Omnitrophota bacterium]